MRRLWWLAGGTLAALMGILIGVCTLVGVEYGAPDWFWAVTVGICAIFVLTQFLLAPVIIRRVLKLRYVSPDEISPEFGSWYRKTGEAMKIGSPQFAVIDNGMPNAFTFGRFVKDASVVVTKGLTDSLDEDELKAVVAHEFGHIRNRDFIAMTVVQMIVLLVYMAARMTFNSNGLHGKAVGLVAYAFYWVAEFVGLAFSRVREYGADRTSADFVDKPDALASALIKIGYGMARLKVAPEAVTAEDAETKAKKKKKSKLSQSGISGMGIMGIAACPSVAMAAMYFDADGAINPESFKTLSRWELVNPWAGFSELRSTHPLIYKRVRALMGHPYSEGRFQVEDAASLKGVYKGRFVAEFALFAMPLTVYFVTLLGSFVFDRDPFTSFFAALTVTCVAYLIRLCFVFPKGSFAQATIRELLENVNASPVAPIGATVEGKLVSRAEGGLRWSANLVLQDDTGMVLLRRRLVVFPFLSRWGWVRAKKLVGENVRVKGWYRRFSGPYLEIMEFENLETGEVVKSTYEATAFTWLAGLIAFFGFLTWLTLYLR